ncbi:uncharacterized protein LOC129752088 [Uranotaenia lowii]|uniref:uncharacterized protein LOC129752088 n=1 Tax=Uranotaenia lowii TaxID=190385 RepID=UPI00247A9A82|nr:uncharacterized protein LOC129752088 [Uranotaenia lowii]
MILREPSADNYAWNWNQRILVGCKNALTERKCDENFKKSYFACPEAIEIVPRKKEELSNHDRAHYDLGFEVDDRFLPYYEIFYDLSTCSVIWTKHELLGSAFDQTAKLRRAETDFRSFPCPDVEFSTAYTQLKQSEQPHLGTNESFYYQKGHLTPDHDAPYYWWKLATFSYGNVAPEWITINGEGGNWFMLERFVYRLAVNDRKRYEIFTGVLPYDPPKYLVPEGKISIPHWFWKVVKHQTQGVVVFVLNDPNPSESDVAKKFCPEDQCAALGWEFPKNRSKGLAHCCSYESEVLNLIPQQASFEELLTLPSYTNKKTARRRPTETIPLT